MSIRFGGDHWPGAESVGNVIFSVSGAEFIGLHGSGTLAGIVAPCAKSNCYPEGWRVARIGSVR
jgi:hypothetical protein